MEVAKIIKFLKEDTGSMYYFIHPLYIADDNFKKTILYLAANLQNCLKMQSMLSYRLTCAYFVVGSLCLLKVLDDPDKLKQLPFTKDQIIEWVYSFHIGDKQNAVYSEEIK